MITDIIGATDVGAAAIWISGGRSIPDDRLLVGSSVLVADDLSPRSSTRPLRRDGQRTLITYRAEPGGERPQDCRDRTADCAG